ncbi:MAG: arsenite methyltransferase [Oleiphilaceae bacterium]|jgi:arsenite methyltransferase
MHDDVKEYYGNVLQQSEDLKTNACCTSSSLPKHVKQALSKVHNEVMSKYYGCGLIAPDLLKDMHILDLGCGSGRDCYVLSQWVGEQGRIVGVDMTEAQLNVALEHEQFHADLFGYEIKNTEFKLGFIEKLDELNLPDNSFDIIVSNCVINLSPDKEAVLREAFRLLKPGGELYFSDIYSNKRIPAELVNDPVLYGECLSGALYWNDFENLAKKAGFIDPRLVEDDIINIENESVEAKIGHIEFYSATYRLFKIEGLEPSCEDFGQAVIYKGGIAYSDNGFMLDKHHYIQKGKVFPVCGNTYRMLNETRFKKYFEFIGNWDTHYGIFEGCGSSIPFEPAIMINDTSGGGCC